MKPERIVEIIDTIKELEGAISLLENESDEWKYVIKMLKQKLNLYNLLFDSIN